MRLGRITCALLLFLAACGERRSPFDVPTPVVPDPTSPRRPTPVPLPPSGPTELYDDTRVLEVDLFVEQADWEVLRKQTYGGAEAFLRRRNCQEVEAPFTWFRAAAVIDREVVENVGVKKRGFLWSDNAVRPSLEISFDLYEPGKRFAGRDRIVLESGVFDPTSVRTCLAYRVFERAGVPAPRCNLARVRVNGFSLGLYANVEPVDRAFVAEHFTAGGTIWEGRGSDFRSGWLTSFIGSGDRARLGALATALEAPNAQLEAELSAVMDLDAFHRFWAVETLVEHFQGYAGGAHQFFVYDDPERGFSFVPTATDYTFWTLFPFATAVVPPGEIVRRLDGTREGRTRHLAEVEAVMAEAWDEKALLEEIDRFGALVSSNAPLRTELETALDQLARYVSNRRAEVEAVLADGGFDWSDRRRPTYCIGRLTADFETTWGTLDAADPFQVGSATISADYGTVYYPTAPGFAIAGEPGEGKEARAVLAAGAPTPTGAVVLQLQLPRAVLLPGRHDLEEEGIEGAVSFIRAGQTEWELIGYLSGGTLDLAAAGTEGNAIIVGRLEADLY